MLDGWEASGDQLGSVQVHRGATWEIGRRVARESALRHGRSRLTLKQKVVVIRASFREEVELGGPETPPLSLDRHTSSRASGTEVQRPPERFPSVPLSRPRAASKRPRGRFAQGTDPGLNPRSLSGPSAVAAGGALGTPRGAARRSRRPWRCCAPGRPRTCSPRPPRIEARSRRPRHSGADRRSGPRGMRGMGAGRRHSVCRQEAMRSCVSRWDVRRQGGGRRSRRVLEHCWGPMLEQTCARCSLGASLCPAAGTAETHRLM